MQNYCPFALEYEAPIKNSLLQESVQEPRCISRNYLLYVVETKVASSLVLQPDPFSFFARILTEIFHQQVPIFLNHEEIGHVIKTSES